MLLSVALLSCLTAGCSTDTGSPADTGRPHQKDAASAQGPPIRDLTSAEEVEIDRAEQDLVVQCMQRQGFRYWPFPVPELIKPQRPWKALSNVELATAEYVDWYNHCRLHGEIGHVPPAEYEATHYQNTQEPQVTATI